MALAQELEQQQGRLDTQQQGELSAIADLERQQAQTAGERQQATAGPLAAATSAAEDLGKTADQPLPPSEAAGIGYTPHKADAKDIESLSWALLGMALVGGATSKGNWLGVSSLLNGAMTGFIKGDRFKAQREWEDFQTKFDTAERHDKEAIERLRTVRDNKNLSLNAKMQQYQLISAQYDMQDVKTAAAIKSHDAVLKQIDARENSILQARTRLEVVAEKVNQQTTAARDTSLPPGFDQEKVDYYARQSIAGDQSWRTGLGRSKQGVKIIAAVDARVPELAKEHGITPEAASVTKDQRHSIARALDDRQKFVAASTQFVSNFQKQADLVDKYVNAGTASGIKALNAWIQGGRKQIGVPEVDRLDTAIRGLAREHQRIVTGVTSNAQLHVDAAKTGDELINIDKTEASIRATLEVMREEADNALTSGKEEVGRLQEQLKHLGVAGDQTPNKTYKHPSGATVEILSGT